ncbi:MAG TPA: 16S rRNA (uracil(1498)-N(3))-methyltransferase [Mycobacteriales bacterium]|nr:16S rRNA (uracil(1498)-N(3))-methyltransferase [Mycobacteriales bacterium]
MTPPLFYVSADQLADDPVVVSGDEGRHAAVVRRIRVGEVVMVGDGAGNVVHGSVTEVQRAKVSVGVQRRETTPRHDPTFVVAQAMAKGGRDEDAVETMTEVGVDEVIGWEAARCVARWTDRSVTRWSTTARAAAKQSRRSWVPVVTGPASTSQLAQRLESATLGIVLHEVADRSLSSVTVPAHGDVVIAIGPEGGIADDELETLASAGAIACRLGSEVLRTSTAGVAALSVLSAATRWK